MIPAHTYIIATEAKRHPIAIDLWLFNSGNRTARDASVFLFLPDSWRVPGWEGALIERKFFEHQGLKIIGPATIDGKRYWHVSAHVTSPTYPGIENLAHSFIALVPADSKADVLWRVGCDDGVNPPQNEPEGRLPFHVFNLPSLAGSPDS